jgi:twinkle protein
MFGFSVTTVRGAGGIHMGLNAAVIQWAARRKIRPETLRVMNAGGDAIPFGSGGSTPAILFNYLDADGQIVNWKARSLTEKLYRQQPGGTQQFFNQAAVLAGPLAEVYITEGEMDACALVEAGVPPHSVLSVVGGAPAAATEDASGAQRYAYVAAALAAGLDRCRKFVLVTDSDSPGRHLRSDLAVLLGAASCHWIDWPEDVKDANDALAAWGAEALSLYLREAVKEFPLDGVYRLSEIPEPPALITWRGWAEWEQKLKISPTCLSVLSGWPGHGKSHLSQQLWAHIARRHDIRVALMSMETREKPHVRRNLRSAYWGKLEIEMSDAETKEADDWIEDRFLFLHHPHSSPTFPWILDKINDCHARHAISAVSIDPWNMIVPTFDRREQTETSWIGRCLDDCTYIAKACNLHLQVLAHPAKPLGAGVHEPITYSSIAGSQHWANKADQVLSIHRNKFTDDDGRRNTDARLIVHKSRYEELGYPCEIAMKLALETGCYRCTEYDSRWQGRI